MNSEFGKLKGVDFWKGLVMFVVAAVLMFLGNLANIVNLTWEQVAGTALVATATYLLKNLGTTSDGKFLGIGK